jgi:predicted metal-binding membrane protein
MVGGGLVSKASPATVTFARTLSMFTVVKVGVLAKASEPMLVMFLGIFKVVSPLY